MLYNEFIEGTGCKDNEHNYKVYKDLEVMYMNSDMTKAQIYEYGKKLVDNSKSEAELKAEAEIKVEIEEVKDEIKWYKEKAQLYTEFLTCGVALSLEEEKEYKKWVKHYKNEIKTLKGKIAALKWVLA